MIGQSCILFGGSGYIGQHLARFLIERKHFAEVICADLIERDSMDGRIKTIHCDVRKAIDPNIIQQAPDWIFNLAAICREPGHDDEEFFETNILGARNVCDYSEKVGCNNIYFTSTMSVYGYSKEPSDESRLPQPITAYGISKLIAEVIHEKWLNGGTNRRLVMSRPGVIYGPGDEGNVLRMIRAIQKGYFFIPGSGSIRKSYGYIHGLLESISFTIEQNENLIVYNYVEKETKTITSLATSIVSFLGVRRPILTIPKSILLVLSRFLQLITGNRSSIHPVRVKKANFPTYLLPKYLISKGFDFKYDFESSLVDWKERSPEDFDF